MKKLEKPDIKKFLREDLSKKRIINGSYSVGITAVFIAVILVLNLIVQALPKKYTELDLSEGKLFTITEETEKQMKALNKDVTLYFITQTDNKNEVINKMLQRYADSSEHITVEQKDPVVYPAFTSAYTSDEVEENSVIVVCGDKSKVVPYEDMYTTEFDYTTYGTKVSGYDGEGQITSAIAYVTSDNMPVLYTLEGHGEADISSTLQKLIEKSNIQVEKLNLLTKEAVPDDAGCLMVAAPTKDISQDEASKIISYLKDGGKAILFSNYGTEETPNFDSITENYGLKRKDGVIFEGNQQYYTAQAPYFLLPEVKNHDITGTLYSNGNYILVPIAQAIQINEDLRETIAVQSLLTTSDNAYIKKNIVNMQTYEKEEEDEQGCFDIATAVTETVNGEDNNAKETRLVYFTSMNILQEDVDSMVTGSNSQLVSNAVNWLCNVDGETAVSIPAKSLDVEYLTLTAYDTSFWGVMAIGIIPALLLITGLVIWLKRRKQ